MSAGQDDLPVTLTPILPLRFASLGVEARENVFILSVKETLTEYEAEGWNQQRGTRQAKERLDFDLSVNAASAI